MTQAQTRLNMVLLLPGLEMEICSLLNGIQIAMEELIWQKVELLRMDQVLLHICEMTAHGEPLPEVLPTTGGTQVVSTDATLSGTGVSGSPLKIAQQSATTGQVLKWSGSTWTPGDDAGGLTNPMDAAGEMIIGGTSGNPTAIPAPGAPGLVLTASSTTTAAWAAPSSGFSNPMKTRGDLIYYGASGTTRLGLGGAGETLISNGTDAYWGIPSGSSKWTTDAYGINHQSGNVGIGAAKPLVIRVYLFPGMLQVNTHKGIDNLSDSGNGLEINAGLSSSSSALKVNDYNTEQYL